MAILIRPIAVPTAAASASTLHPGFRQRPLPSIAAALTRVAREETSGEDGG